MSRGQEFLIEVTEKLNTKIQELGRTIREVQEDIAGMNDYY